MRRLRQRLQRLRRRMLFEAQFTVETCMGSQQFPHTDQPVWLLGVKYSALEDAEREKLQEDFRTRLWFTYRRGFVGIGGEEGPTSDKGWGCMLRCGQMVLAEAMMRHALGRAWRWRPETKDPMYLKLLALFDDSPRAPYSIHQIALTGQETAGKPVGTWFGPNTVGQALRVAAAAAASAAEDGIRSSVNGSAVSVKSDLNYDGTGTKPRVSESINSVLDAGAKVPPSSAAEQLRHPAIHVAMDSCLSKQEAREECVDANGCWMRPLLLLVPLRLGLSQINPVYESGVKSVFKVPHAVGIIGGTPNHALYFVGSVGDRLVYLDPHTTQQSEEVGAKTTDVEREADLSFHCAQPGFMRIASVDPSMAVAFFCRGEAEFDSLCHHVQRLLIDNEKHPLFEMCERRPDRYTDPEPASLDFEAAGGAAAACSGESEDEFVLL